MSAQPKPGAMSDRLPEELPSPHELLGRALRSLDRHVADRGVRWGHVAEIFGLGSTYASRLCRAFELDPGEQIGPTEWERLEAVICDEGEELTVQEWDRVTGGAEPPPPAERYREGAGYE